MNEAQPVARQAKLLLVVACALVDAESRVLIAQRPEGKQLAGLWEFPGGKVEAHECPEETLVRELAEELDIVVDQKALIPLTFASHRYETFHLFMPLYICRHWQRPIRVLEHQAILWVKPGELSSYQMPPADDLLIPHLVGAIERCPTHRDRATLQGC